MMAIYQLGNNPTGWVGMHCPREGLWVGILIVSAPLGMPLHLATKDEIWRGEFVDSFSLLFRET